MRRRIVVTQLNHRDAGERFLHSAEKNAQFDEDENENVRVNDTSSDRRWGAHAGARRARVRVEFTDWLTHQIANGKT